MEKIILVRLVKLNAPPEKCKVHLIRQNGGGALNLTKTSVCIYFVQR
jgi:hypothetical protein